MDSMLQLQADQLGVTVRRPTDHETTALGAAYLAGLAEGVWPSLEAIAGEWQLDAVFDPERGPHARPTRRTPRGAAPSSAAAAGPPS